MFILTYQLTIEFHREYVSPSKVIAYSKDEDRLEILRDSIINLRKKDCQNAR